MRTASLYQARASWLHRLDPRVKLVLMLCLMTLGFVYQNLWFLLGLILFELVLFTSSRLSHQQLTTTMLALLPVSLLMLVLRWIFYPTGRLIFTVGPIALTLGGLATGAVVALRIMALALAVLIWLGSTSNQDVVRSLVAMGLPYSWGLSFALALRFLPDFFQTYRSIEQAQQSRGLDFSGAPLLDQIRMRQPILIAMLIASFRKSEQLAVALEARGFGADQTQRTQYRPLTMAAADWLALTLLLFGFIILLLLNLVAGIGSQPL